MTINVKVTVPETAKWRAYVGLQTRGKDDQHQWGAYADASHTTIEPGSSSDFAVTDSTRIVVEEIPLANTETEAQSADAEADETDNKPESNAG